MIQTSVVMPVKNAGTTLERALRSIQRQSFAAWELIAIDDGSSDESTRILANFSKTDSRIRSVTYPNKGIVNALNCGIALASGRFIARMDADDFSRPDRLKLQISFLNENQDIGLVGSCVNYLGDSSTQQGYATYVDWTNSLLTWEQIRANRFVESPYAHPSVMFRKSIVTDSAGPYRSGPFPEDYELWLRWMDQGIKMGKLSERLLDWYDPPERLSRNDPRYDPKAFYKTKASYLAKWLIHEGHSQRPIWIWGAGRVTRKRSIGLNAEGIRFAGYLDIDPRKIGGLVDNLPVVDPDKLYRSANPFIISYVGNRGARAEIKSYLLARQFLEERDFILAA